MDGFDILPADLWLKWVGCFQGLTITTEILGYASPYHRYFTSTSFHCSVLGRGRLLEFKVAEGHSWYSYLPHLLYQQPPSFGIGRRLLPGTTLILLPKGRVCLTLYSTRALSTNGSHPFLFNSHRTALHRAYASYLRKPCVSAIPYVQAISALL